MRRIITLVLLGCVTPVWAQSLAEIAAKEKKRRETQAKATSGKPVPSYGDDDLKGRTPEESTDEAAKAAGETTRNSVSSDPDSGSYRRSGSSDDQKRRLAESIRGRLLTCQDEAAEASERVKTIETYLANLQPRPFHNMEADRQDLERLLKEARADVDRMRRRCDDIQDEARKANIPAGWVR